MAAAVSYKLRIVLKTRYTVSSIKLGAMGFPLFTIRYLAKFHGIRLMHA